MNIICPYCNEANELDCDDLPNNVCDNKEYECKFCENSMEIGWYATAEVRKVTVELGDIDDQ